MFCHDYGCTSTALIKCLGLTIALQCMLPSFGQQQLQEAYKINKQEILIQKDIRIGNYLGLMDSVVKELSKLYAYPITEYELVHHNKWLIDSLANTDYYLQKRQGKFIHDQKDHIILKHGMSLQIPDSVETVEINSFLQSIQLLINLPAFELRIMAGSNAVRSCKIRIGKPDTLFLAMAGKPIDLHTRTGKGKIIRVIRNPVYINPVTNQIYHSTLRDDGVTTKLPLIPWLEPEIDGTRPGQLIHPTTNVRTLGMASSNGCIGTSEADAWHIYYHAPLNTPVKIIYDMNSPPLYDTHRKLVNVYNRKN